MTCLRRYWRCVVTWTIAARELLRYIIASFCKLSRFPPELSLSSTRSTLTVSQLITIANYRLYRIKKFLRCLFRLGWRAYQVALPSSPCDSRSYLKEIQICLRKSSLPPWLPFNSMEVTSLPSPTSQGTKALNEIFIRKSSCFFACALCACFMLLYGAWYIFHGMSSMNLRLEHKETTTLRRKSLATSRALILLSEIAAKKGWNDVHLILQCSSCFSFHKITAPNCPSSKLPLIDKGSFFVIETLAKDVNFGDGSNSNRCQHETKDISLHVASATSVSCITNWWDYGTEAKVSCAPDASFDFSLQKSSEWKIPETTLRLKTLLCFVDFCDSAGKCSLKFRCDGDDYIYYCELGTSFLDSIYVRGCCKKTQSRNVSYSRWKFPFLDPIF